MRSVLQDGSFAKRANKRYLDAFATLDDSTRMAELIGPLQQPCQYRDRRVRALRPFADDYLLLEAVNRGEFMTNGLRNGDLQRLLWSTAPLEPKEKRRRSAAVSRKLRLAVAHGLIHKGAENAPLPSQRKRAISHPGDSEHTANQHGSSIQGRCLKIVAARKQIHG
jgi:hypothetical protein